jgi:hypothetical protein
MMWLSGIVGEKAVKWVVIAFAAALLIGAILIVSRCSHDNTAERQSEQTSASGGAIANAAADAIETITNRTVTEGDIDAATATAQEEIENASDPDTVRGAVIAGVCGQASHRNDPACRVR